MAEPRVSTFFGLDVRAFGVQGFRATFAFRHALTSRRSAAHPR